MTLRPETRQRLLDISARFYEQHGSSFDATRSHPWPGWKELWKQLQDHLSIQISCFDVGCGNGRFRLFLEAFGEAIIYTGVDLDRGLLDIARRELSHLPDVRLIQRNLLERTEDIVPEASQDVVVLFGVLHHVPDESQRHRLLTHLASRVAPGGVLVASIWRLDQDTERFARKTISWSEWNGLQSDSTRIDPSDLDEGDTLLGWRGDRTTPRYCHFPTDAEIERLAELGPEIELLERFEADGPTERDNLYLVWRRRDPPPVPC